MTRIDVISGFLGAGKTTFIKKLLSEALKTEKVVLIENEFGQIGIDSGFLKDAGIEIKEMSQGCICCSLVGDFEKSLQEVITTYKPERIIIEPSGVGKLSDVMKAVTDASESLDVILNSAVTVVDASKCKMYTKNFGEFFNNQIQYAGTCVLTRTDITPEDKIKEAVEIVKSLNENAELITTPVAELSGEKLLEVIEKRNDMLEELRADALRKPDGESEEEHMHHHHHHHDGEECDDPDCCCHHHHDDDECDEHGHHHHHHHDEDECDEHEHHHHHHHHHDDDECYDHDEGHDTCCHDDDDDENECHHHHDIADESYDDPEKEALHRHHHDCHEKAEDRRRHHENGEECDDPECECHHNHDDDDEEHGHHPGPHHGPQHHDEDEHEPHH
ncbi:MAG: GTP-binding protein, partial [Eubacteriales bacterium]|nr:GTP-binding protein [Eubacteriales bacterium]